MITEKHYWKCIYTWIKYFNYHVVHRNQDDSEIWLANKKKQSVAIFEFGANSTQEVRFAKSRIQEKAENIVSFLDFSPKNYATMQMRITKNTCAIHHYNATWKTTLSKIKDQIVAVGARLFGEEIIEMLKRKIKK